ncbi:hypothetical protein BDW02DRAFT_489502 [Decorospora gaudefroyi]|uniref:Uncharacterized protein n=1 Tax=Decorospora gaudefroyi TaxID=184978 RepID=A0A6A5KX90_9PLEO|nr:hypothetical protein BDW02DRAFT_489502 [Decorospora gaudefroyi]
MVWWRRDTTLSPVYGRAQRLLRSHSAALRSRCFSCALSKSAQHEDDNNGSKRPAGMSNLEWMQLQHYQRWRKRLMDDPYQAIFGASNSRLAGKGLSDWEWIHKSFPKWMLWDMESRRDPRRVQMRDEEAAARFERHGSNGIESPSDTRRPREQSITSFESPAPLPPRSTDSFTHYLEKVQLNAEAQSDELSKAASAADASVMRQLLRAKRQETQDQRPDTGDVSTGATWRQTALQRRSVQGVIAPTEPVPTEAAPAQVVEAQNESPTTVSPTAPDDHSSTQLVAPMNETATKLAKPAAQATDIPPVRSTSKILSQLPEDDVDFLTAADIRASMRRKRCSILSDKQKEAERLNLEKTFARIHEKDACLDPTITSKFISNQLERRVAHQMREPKADFPSAPQPNPIGALAETVRLDSSNGRLSTWPAWLERGSCYFSKHFWQDPTEEADATKTRLFFDKVMARIRKGRFTMKQVIQDLETDIPGSKPLLKRMKADEELLDSAIRALRSRAVSGESSLVTPKKLRAIQALRLKYQDTDHELDAAYTKLRDLGNPDVTMTVSPAFKRRLSIAAKITEKNAHLTRYLIWSLQARLEDPEIDSRILPHYKVVANSLLTLRDTQLALCRLVERAMLVYGVALKGAEGVDIGAQTSEVDSSAEEIQSSRPQEFSEVSEVDKAQLRPKVAAEERLANEVEAQKSAMRGLSDDGYARAPKPVIRKTFEVQDPLAHSLFRPFGPVLDSLSRESTLAAETINADEVAEHKRDDFPLVAEVRKAYEDTCAITVEHKQLADAAVEVRSEQDTYLSQKMLNDGPHSAPLTSPTIDEPTIHCYANPGSRVVPPTCKSVEAQVAKEAVQSSPVALEPSPSIESAAPASELAEPPKESITDASILAASPPLPTANVPTHYTILIYDPQTDKLLLTTSTSGPPRDTSPAMPLHQALTTLEAPAKFVPYISDGHEVVSVKRDMLILRDALYPSSSNQLFDTFDTSSVPMDTDRSTMNPIDGTTRLSPTGYVGPEESQEQLEKEFDERRQAAGHLNKRDDGQRKREAQGERKGGRGASVAKSAIWAAAMCYVVGVFGEIASSS